MTILVLGAGGQLGRALLATSPAEVLVRGVTRSECDVCDEQQVRRTIRDARPSLIFNASAYTAVDRAEAEKETAHLVNASAVGWMAEAAAEAGARFIHVSTDFVFDGCASRPYRPEDPASPLGVYGQSKLEGEIAVQQRLPDALIVRTAWVYGATGYNFVRTMLRLMSERDEVRVVADQIGTPTYVTGLAAALWKLASSSACGIHHYTDEGTASWYDFAVAIQEEALARGLLARAVPVVPIASEDYPTPARRPSFSVLNKKTTWDALGRIAPHWRENLRRMLDEVKSHG